MARHAAKDGPVLNATGRNADRSCFKTCCAFEIACIMQKGGGCMGKMPGDRVGESGDIQVAGR
jgi:hypothetical protein